MFRSTQLLLLTAAGLAAAPSASAQFTATFVAKSRMFASATYSSTGTQTAEIPILSDLAPGRSAVASNGVIASVSAGLTIDSTTVRATITDSGAGRYVTSGTGGSSRNGPHSTLLTLFAPRPTAATLRITHSQQSDRGAFGTAAVDLGDDGSFEFQGSATPTQDFAVTITPQGLLVSTTTSGSATATSTSRYVSYQSDLTIEVLPPDTCQFFSEGAACGPSLDGRNGFDETIVLTATGATPGAQGVVLLGLQRTSSPLPGTSCLLLVRPVIAAPISFRSDGSFELALTLPPSRPLAIPSQVLEARSPLASSNGVTIFCR